MLSGCLKSILNILQMYVSKDLIHIKGVFNNPFTTAAETGTSIRDLVCQNISINSLPQTSF